MNDHDGAVGVMGALLADGAKQQPGKPAVTAGPDHQQIGLGCLCNEDLRGATLDDSALDLDALDVALQPRRHILEQLLGRSVHVAYTAAGERVKRSAQRAIASSWHARIAESPGVDDQQPAPPQSRLCRCPTKGVPRPLGAVDPDHDGPARF